MLEKLKQKLSAKSDEIDSCLREMDFKSYIDQSRDSLRKLIQGLNDETKAEIHEWINQIEKIKASDLTDEEKESQLKKVETSTTVLAFIKVVVDGLADKSSIKRKGLLKAGLTGFGIAFSLLNIELSGAALLLINKALPKFMLSDQFNDFSDFVRRELPMTDTSLVKKEA